MIRAVTRSVGDTRALAGELANLVQPGDLILLSGDLGTGKTAFVQGLARGLGVSEAVTSPAFVLARTYDGRLPLAHLDVYRLEHLQELIDIGIAELLDEAGVTVVEWGEVVVSVLPADFLEVRLEVGDGDDDRNMELAVVGSGWQPRMFALAAAMAPWSPDPGPPR